MGKLPIGLQLYSVRNELKEDFYTNLKAIKEMGYTHVEFAGLYDMSPQRIKEICNEIGIVPYSAHVARGVIMADLQGVIKDYADIGCKFIAIPWASAEKELPGAEGYDAFLSDIRKIAAECEKYGMALLYHNHDFEFEKIDGKNKLDILYSDTVGVLQTEIDTCWARVGGENPVEYVLKYTGRAPIIHLKDYVGSKSENMYGLIDSDKPEAGGETGKFELRSVGDGVQDVLSILKAAEQAGAGMVIVEQDEPTPGKTSMECAKMSIDYIKSIY